MYCPACGKQIPDNSTFCFHCGTKISAPSVVVTQAPMQWEYSEFVWTPPPNSQAIAGDDRLSEARELWWSEARPFVLEGLQKWQAEGWEPVGAVGSDCIQVEEMQVMSSRYWNGAAWLMWLFSLVPTFGLSLFALFLKKTVYKPVNIRVQMRAPQGTKAPISLTMPIQSGTSPISTSKDEPSAASDAGINIEKEAKDILKQRGISWKMSKNIQNSQSEIVGTVEQEDTFHNPDRLINLSTWSAVLAWVFFATGAAFIVADLVLIIQGFPNIRTEIVSGIIFSLLIFVLGLICIFFGLILRIVSEGVLLLMDIEDNTHRKEGVSNVEETETMSH